MDSGVLTIDFLQPNLFWRDEAVQSEVLFSIAPVQHKFDFINALRLIHRQYLLQGYCRNNGCGLFYGIHHLCPHAQMVNFKYKYRIIATVTKFKDSDLFGLPMDALYKKELDTLRARGRKIVECGSLASIEEKFFQNAVIYLQRATIYSCMDGGMDDLCIAVNPKHVSFYKRFFLFQDLGPERHYKMVHAPAVALRLPLDELKETIERGDYKKSNAYTRLSFFRNKLFQGFLDMDNNILNESVFTPGGGLIQRLMGLKPELAESLTNKQKEFFVNKLGIILE